MGVRHKALRFGVPGALVALSLGVSAYLVLEERPGIRAMIAREESALLAVREAASAEKRFAAKRLKDSNGDGSAEFGGLDELSAAGLVLGPISKDAEGGYEDIEGYRLEVLLPDGRDRTGRISLSRANAAAEPLLAAIHFAVVALPKRGMRPGLRGFYLDERGRLYVAEGVCDASGDPHQAPPVRLLLDTEEDLGNEGPVWRLREDPKPSPK